MNAKKRNQRILYGSVVVAVVALIIVFYLIYSIASADPYAKYIGDPVSTTMANQLSGVSYSTLASVGEPSGVTPPNKLSGPLLTSNGVPEVLYVGGEFCPYCGAERWSIIVALSQFGQFGGLELMQSSSTDVNPNTPTFTFAGPHFKYTSKFVSFVPVEEYNRAEGTLTNLSSTQSSLVDSYDVCPSTKESGGIPFIDVANLYAVSCGAQVDYTCPGSICISDENWSQISSQLNTPGSNNTPASQFAEVADGAANTLIAAICDADAQVGLSPPVCSQSFASVPLANVSPVPGSAPETSLMVAPAFLESKWTA